MAYIPRLTAPAQNDPWYNSDLNPYYRYGWGMPNCTAYAWSRAWEIAGYTANLPSGPPLAPGHNAELWWTYNDGWPRGQTPALGAIACYAGGDFQGVGHVCVLEKDNGNGTWLVSESALNAYYFRASHSISADGDYGYGHYTFQGFIYNPWADQPSGGNFKWWMSRKLIYQRKGIIYP